MPEMDLAHARTDHQKGVMERAIKDGVCSFCEDFCRGKPPTYHTNPVIKDGTWWVLTTNFAPQNGAQLQFLIVYKDHVNTPTLLPPEAWIELGEITRWALEDNRIEGGALYMRFGDTEYSGATMSHLHANIIFGGTTRALHPNATPVRIKVGYAIAAPT